MHVKTTAVFGPYHRRPIGRKQILGQRTAEPPKWPPKQDGLSAGQFNWFLASCVQAKVAAQKGTATFVSGNFVDWLTHQVAPCHTKRTESRAEQHYGRAAIWNTAASWAEEDPAGKTISKRAKGRNRDYPS